MNKFKAIETEYNGYKFRSRLEARWAVFFDSLGIKYEYEPEGFEFEDGTKYLPDFYLPDSNQWFEVKGVMEEYDEKKIQHAIDAGLNIIVGYDKGEFESSYVEWGDSKEKYTLGSKSESWLCKCKVCKKYYFGAVEEGYVCKCCNAYDGYHHFEVVMEGKTKDSVYWKEYADELTLNRLRYIAKDKEKEYFDNHLWKDARMARFEFGDSKAKGEE